MLFDLAVPPVPLEDPLSEFGVCIAFAVVAVLCLTACLLIRRALKREREKRNTSK